MRPIAGTPVLTAGEMREAEGQAIAAGASVQELMDRAGAGVAEAVRRLGGGVEALVLCGPGNNGGDGYVAARLLAAGGVPVRVAAAASPVTAAARDARARWTGAVGDLVDAAPAPVLVDALFGTGLTRALTPELVRDLHRLRDGARLAIAVDLPSGAASDDGALLSDVPVFDVTLALGAAKPAHLLQPAAGRVGEVRLIDIGVAAEGDVRAMRRPVVAPPGAADHKFSRGMVAVVAGRMHGAAELAACAAYGAGAGYVLLLGGGLPLPPHAIVRRPYGAEALADPRIGALVVGPGLGRDDRARERLDAALTARCPLVIDGDALHLLDGGRLGRLAERAAPVVLTPHAGEFDACFREVEGSKIARARAAAKRSGATIVFKGADTVIAAPDGAVRIAPQGDPWLSVAGTGDVLAGAIAALVARGGVSLNTVGAAVWLHGQAAREIAPPFLADDLADALPLALARCR